MSEIITVGRDPLADRRMRSNRPRGRFVPVKSEEVQRAGRVFRVQELLIRQRTQQSIRCVKSSPLALRGHLTEFGQMVPLGAANASKLIAIVEDPDIVLPVDAIPTLKVLIAVLAHLGVELAVVVP